MLVKGNLESASQVVAVGWVFYVLDDDLGVPLDSSTENAVEGF
jgi:Na+/serine symporter